MKFTSKERDAETGLDFLEARYFSSAQGRFTGPDQPLLDQWESDPQSWNLYSYARNNPLRFTDPTGLTCQKSTEGTVYDDGDGKGCQEVDESYKKKKVDLVVHGDVSRADLFISEMAGRRLASFQMIGVVAGSGAAVGTGLGAAGAFAGGGLTTLGASPEISGLSESVSYTFASGAEYQPVIRELEALGRAGTNVKLSPQQVRALLQNMRDVLKGTYQAASRDPKFIESLKAQSQLGRWKYLDQVPPAAQGAFREALGKFGITIP